MKNVVITGSSRGIGFELTKLFSDKGFKVFALSRNISIISNLKLPNVVPYYLDISSEKSISKVVKLISKELKQVDVLINNAGNLINKPFSQTSFHDFESIYKVNVFGLAELVRQFIPYFCKSSHVINISSIGGIAGSSKFSGLSAYSSSKGALNILTEMLCEEFKDSGPSFNCLALGAVQTEMLEEAFPGYQAQVSSLEMANYIYKFSLEGNKFFNGKIIPVSTSNP
ncbi:MAG: SDR family oxidoreductase [Flavobacteriaceae bacterium]|mgnify:CR=1 FL=1|jgi:NAD(P)-dependent dehydrogenase (short-subunit alcohol dehydrogenase family)|nr:SDR family oxidoreductase [Flavobacteriaceae bacterium]MBT3754063.1 SDR family oxidoreductase [Flavobacteriaceae bacterium]MBT3794533.1 SDR family oxidoreductase [Flavobacteriaceae bacterium]MBT4246823.1 SDR family oxidoreductase [Flavobacteriaceae bacterium]MBT4414923.1 SDR family oxidoreductase [Flavobacteriaceae bacterium]|tara:strand:- start:2846 stop:3526 length:681 start_codon:yes stop_codon:yes gene_type:complete